MATFVQTFSSPSDTEPEYRNLDLATVIRAAQDPVQSQATSKYYARGTIDGRDFFFLDLDGYDDAATCQAAIETALSIS